MFLENIPSLYMIWREVQKRNFTKVNDLIAFLELSDEQVQQLDLSPSFVLNLPLRLAEKMRKGALDDPLFRQFVPLSKENDVVEGFCSDPVGEAHFRPSGKLLHKYTGRALLVTTSACAMHCRYCFRREFPYETTVPNFEKELEAVKADTTLSELLLSGGDPLSLSNRALKELLTRIEEIPHIRRVRFHTRFPMGIPERIDEELLELIGGFAKQLIFVVHINHIVECDDDVWGALRRIQRLGIPVLSQTVLLKGVNDTVESLRELFLGLIDHGIMPYYLHQLDRVSGASHFEVPIASGMALMKELEKLLPGYALPKYVQEIPGMHAKTPVKLIKTI